MPLPTDAACAALKAAHLACHVAVIDCASRGDCDSDTVDTLVCAAEYCERAEKELHRD